jgi:hypothetical protein
MPTKRKRTEENVDAAENAEPQLAMLGRNTHITKSGIADLLTVVKTHGMPKHFSKSTQARHRKAICAAQTPYGTLVQKMTVPIEANEGQPSKSIDIALQHPLAVLFDSCKNLRGFARVVKETMAKTPCSVTKPWHVVLYNDEIGPSGAIGKTDERKAVAVYWSILEFGQHILSREEFWFTAFVVRTNVVNQVPGGLSFLYRKMLHAFFSLDHDFEHAGICVSLHGAEDSPVRLFAKMGISVADEPALKSVLMCKGHAGTIPCILCRNVVEAAHDGTGLTVPLGCIDASKWHQSTDDIVRETMLRLQAKRKWQDDTAFKLSEQACGFNYHPENLILDETLNFKAVSTFMFDWAHTYLMGGLLDNELGVFFKLAKNAEITSWEIFGSYLEKWVFPKAFPSVHHLFVKKENDKHYSKEQFNGSGSQLLTVYPVLARFFMGVVLRKCREEKKLVKKAQSLISLFDVVDVLQNTKLGTVDGETLRTAIFTHLRRHQSAYGTSLWKPKHHYSAHLHEFLDRFKVLIAVFTQERKHKTTKEYQSDHKNTTSYELGIVEEITVDQRFSLEEEHIQNGMLDKAPLNNKRLQTQADIFFQGYNTENLMVSRKVKSMYGTMVVGDFVLVSLSEGMVVAKLLFNVELEGQEVCVIEPWIRTPHSAKSNDGGNSSTWTQGTHMASVSPTDMYCSVVYTFGTTHTSIQALTPATMVSLFR